MTLAITVAVAPSDPRVGIFTLDRVVTERSVVCRNIASAAGSPLFEELFALPGVVQVWVQGPRVTVAVDREVDWPLFAKTVGEAIRRVLAAGGTPVAEPSTLGDTQDLSGQIRAVLVAELNPSLAAHGGSVELVKLENRVAHVRFQGGCQGCSAAAQTLSQGIRQTLLARFPTLSDVTDDTDHASGEKPYYPAASGTSPFQG